MQQKFCESPITTEMFRLRMNSFLEKQFDRIVQMQFLKGNQFPIGITICRVNKKFFEAR